jgi:hypothetical protein
MRELNIRILPMRRMVTVSFLLVRVLQVTVPPAGKIEPMHQRLMLLSSIVAMEADVSRLPVTFLDSLLKVHLANDAILLNVVIADSINHRRLHPAFLWGSLFLVSMQTLTALLSHTDTWPRRDP